MEEKLLESEKIEFCPHVQGTLEKLPDDALFVVDRTLLQIDARVSEFLRNRTFHVFDASEKNKTLQETERVYEFLFEHQLNQPLVALGGGITGDLTGFAAATFKRGIPFLMVPTTLLSMCDSAVGGKCGVNFRGIKNYIGCFSKPNHILISTEFLHTLSDRELRSGLGEIIKYGLIGEPDILHRLLAHHGELRTLPLEDFIRSGLVIKAKLVQEDYRDQGMRNILNFGHNVGHALESMSQGTITHGEAVAMGMLAELEISRIRLGTDASVKETVMSIMDQYGMRKTLGDIAPQELIRVMRKDKKNDEKLRFTLLKRMGEPVIKVQVDEEEILQALTVILE